MDWTLLSWLGLSLFLMADYGLQLGLASRGDPPWAKAVALTLDAAGYLATATVAALLFLSGHPTQAWLAAALLGILAAADVVLRLAWRGAALDEPL